MCNEHFKVLRAATSIEILHAVGMPKFSLNFLNLFRGNANFGSDFFFTHNKGKFFENFVQQKKGGDGNVQIASTTGKSLTRLATGMRTTIYSFCNAYKEDYVIIKKYICIYM